MGTFPSGLDAERLAAWFAAELGAESPLRFEELGPSTLRAEDGTGRAWVLRVGGHDVARAHRVVTALAGSDVPVPAPALSLIHI